MDKQFFNFFFFSTALKMYYTFAIYRFGVNGILIIDKDKDKDNKKILHWD